jgi:hypothetical protein
LWVVLEAGVVQRPCVPLGHVVDYRLPVGDADVVEVDGDRLCVLVLLMVVVVVVIVVAIITAVIIIIIVAILNQIWGREGKRGCVLVASEGGWVCACVCV